MSEGFVITDFGAEAGSSALQTEYIQRALDMCREHGGTVIIPKGRFYTGSLRMWSDTTLYLQSGAQLIGSDDCDDYEVYEVPEGVELRTDIEMIPNYFEYRQWGEYRRAIVSVYGGKNISVIGEEGSLIDGNDCADPNGEEGYRGPHGFMITNVENLTLRGYTAANCGNFMHQVDNCQNIVMENVTCLGGSDGIHLHCCKHIRIENCRFRTGDDCVAGINMEDLTVRNCEMNSSCDIFRMGGSHFLIENCHMSGPGEYPHRVTVMPNRGTPAVKDKKNALSGEQGRHNLEGVFLLFASPAFPADEPYHDIVFRNCTIENSDIFMWYEADDAFLQRGAYLSDVTLENVKISGLKGASRVKACQKVPLTVVMKNVSASFREGATDTVLFDGRDENTELVTVNATAHDE